MQLDYLFCQIAREKDVQWSEQGMASSYKFVQKLWILHCKSKIKFLTKTIMMIKKLKSLQIK